jgi:signal transduction histidine kinase
LLIECDDRGQVLWMSERTRTALGEAANLVDTITAQPSAAATPRIAAAEPLRFWCVLKTGDGVLISAQPGHPEVPASEDLAGLHGNLLGHYFRLQRAERNLSTRARRSRGGGGAQALRQIELERQRLGRELHTGVGQMLAAIRLQLEIITRQLPSPPAPVQQALGRIATLADDALEQVRFLSRRLHPPEWQRLSLQAALRQLWEISGVPEKFDASLRIGELAREPDLEIKVLLYRAAQEALSNLTQHSQATRIDMVLAERSGRLVLTIRDNGVGFDVAALFSAPPNVASGIGLRAIREQAASLGSKINIQSGPSGTTLEVSTPFTPIQS